MATKLTTRLQKRFAIEGDLLAKEALDAIRELVAALTVMTVVCRDIAELKQTHKDAQSHALNIIKKYGNHQGKA